MLLAGLPGSQNLCLLIFAMENNTIDVQNMSEVTQIIFTVSVFCSCVQRMFVSIFVLSAGCFTGQKVELLKIFGLSISAVGFRVNSD